MPEVMPNPLACGVSLQCSENSVKLWRTWICIYFFSNSQLFHLILDTAATQNLAVKAQIME
jgi:hypothetical protein